MLRSHCFDRVTNLPSKSAIRRGRIECLPGIALVVGAALAVGGCSTDLLRFDAPAFSMNDDSSAGGQDYAARSHSGSLSDARTAGYVSTSAPAASGPAPSSRQRYAAADPQPRSGDVYSGSSGRDTSAPLTTGALGGGTITVVPGDTLYQLSRRHGVSVAALRDANNLTGNIIHPGQTLRLPSAGGLPAPGGYATPRPNYVAPREHYSAPRRQPTMSSGASAGRTVTVVQGDSLYAISRRTGVSVADLKRINGITDVRRLRPGVVLSLDGAMARSAPTRQAFGGRTDFGQRSKIQAKPIRTVSIGRDMAPAASEPPPATRTAPAAPATPNAPRLLNGDGREPSSAMPRPSANDDVETVSAGPAVKFRWPAKGRIIATFNHSGRGVRNDGVNISLPLGTPIHAVEDGVVAYAGSELKGYGNLVLLRHDNGWVSAYAHASEVLVRRGDKIAKGQVVAKAGRSGGVTQPQLHFELRKQAKPVDPLPHMAQM